MGCKTLVFINHAIIKIKNLFATFSLFILDSGSSEEAPQRRSTRRANDSKGAATEDDLPLHNAALQELLSDVLKHKDSWPFTRPVTKMEVRSHTTYIFKHLLPARNTKLRGSLRKRLINLYYFSVGKNKKTFFFLN